jgi:hypothetical protein
MPIVAAEMPSGNIVDHGIRYSGSVMPASRWAVPSITFIASMVRYCGTNAPSTMTSLEPVPRRPTTSQESSTI